MGTFSKVYLPEVLEVQHIQKYLNIGRVQTYELVNSGQSHVVGVGRVIGLRAISIQSRSRAILLYFYV